MHMLAGRDADKARPCRRRGRKVSVARTRPNVSSHPWHPSKFSIRQPQKVQFYDRHTCGTKLTRYSGTPAGHTCSFGATSLFYDVCLSDGRAACTSPLQDSLNARTYCRPKPSSSSASTHKQAPSAGTAPTKIPVPADQSSCKPSPDDIFCLRLRAPSTFDRRVTDAKAAQPAYDANVS